MPLTTETSTVLPAGVLATARLILRPLNAGDAHRMTELADDEGVARMTTAIPHPFSRAIADDFIDRMTHCPDDRDVVFALDKPGEGLIGVLGFHTHDGPGPELGYWLGRPYWGQGLATEAANAAMSWAGGDWARRMILSGHFDDNAASGQVLIKAGFLYTGEVQQRYSRARDAEAATRMMIWLS